MTVALDFGHGMGNLTPGKRDPGAVYKDRQEATLVREVGMGIVQFLEPMVDVRLVPEGSLASRVAWITKTLAPQDWVLSLHLNSGGGTGIEVLYDDQKPHLKDDAATLAELVAVGLGLKNRGAKKDTQTPRKSLGLLSNTPRSVLLLEAGFIDNDADMAAVTSKGAQVIALSLLTLLGMAPPANHEFTQAWQKMVALKVYSQFTRHGHVPTTDELAVFLARILALVGK